MKVIINFWSNAIHPFYKLSNFAYVKQGVQYDDLIYPSSEHAYQAQKYSKQDRARFSINGDLGSWDGLRLIV